MSGAKVYGRRELSMLSGRPKCSRWRGRLNPMQSVYSRSHDVVIHVYDEHGNVIETHEHPVSSENGEPPLKGIASTRRKRAGSVAERKSHLDGVITNRVNLAVFVTHYKVSGFTLATSSATRPNCGVPVLSVFY